MLNPVRIYVDFQKVDDEGRLILTCAGTLRDLSRHGVELRDGLTLTFYSDDADDEGRPDDLIVEGSVQYDEQARHWTAVIDWQAIKHASDYLQ
jgi:hypothetical protein